MAASAAFPEFVIWLMEYCWKARGPLCAKNDRNTKNAARTRMSKETAAIHAVLDKPCFARIACGPESRAGAAAAAPDPDSDGEAMDPLATFTRPELVSRFNLFRSARIS